MTKPKSAAYIKRIQRQADDDKAKLMLRVYLLEDEVRHHKRRAAEFEELLAFERQNFAAYQQRMAQEKENGRWR